jgi:hypothetical protein
MSLLVLAQEVIKKRKHINDTWDAEYEVLASDKKIKNGIFTVINTLNKKAIAVGKYVNNQQSGNWLYYDMKGNLVQRYNFDTKKITFDNPLMFDNATYKFPFELSISDSVSVPIKIGGFFYGFDFLISTTNNQALMYAFRANMEDYKMIHYLHIDENGKLINWETSIKSLNNEQKFKNSIDKLENEQKLFSPAIYHEKPISCVMMVELSLKNNSVKKLPYQ